MLTSLSEDEVEQIAFHEIAHGKEYEGLSDAQFNRETKRFVKFLDGDDANLAALTVSKRPEKYLIDAGIQAEYREFDSKIIVKGDDADEVTRFPEYAWRDADRGTQDSELLAESLRFVANEGYGKNRIADAIAKEFGGVQ